MKGERRIPQMRCVEELVSSERVYEYVMVKEAPLTIVSDIFIGNFTFYLNWKWNMRKINCFVTPFYYYRHLYT